MWSTNDQTNSKLIVTNREGKEVKYVGETKIKMSSTYGYTADKKWNMSFDIPWYMNPFKTMNNDMRKMFKRILVQSPFMIID